MGRLRRSYSGVGRSIAAYWSAYGGWLDFAYSPYLHCALLLLVPTVGMWTRDGWWDQTLAVVPNLLGFSLGGFAIFLGVGSEDFRRVISGKSADAAEGHSPYMQAAATFSHFIVVQVVAVVLALVSAGAARVPLPFSGTIAESANRIGRHALWAVSYGAFLYSLLLAVAAVLAVFRTARWYDEYESRRRPPKTPTDPAGTTTASE